MTFVVKVRGAGQWKLESYRCPTHGVFEATVEKDANGNTPDAQPCPIIDTLDEWVEFNGLLEVTTRERAECGRLSPWTISAPQVHTQFVISATRGRSDPKPHANAMDTRLIAEGRRKEFREQRKRVREEARHARVKALLE